MTPLLGLPLWLDSGRRGVGGRASPPQLPRNSVAFCFSKAVLEHVPKRDLVFVNAGSLRALNCNIISVDWIDLNDQLGGTLSDLRFSDAARDGKLFRSSEFYNSRICFGEMLDLFKRVGFVCNLSGVIC